MYTSDYLYAYYDVRYGQYSVLYPQTQEAYVFNRYGQHISTRDLITNKHTYNFTYNVNSYYGE